MGLVDILNGDYAKAAQELADLEGCCFNKTLAYILNDQIDTAKASAKCKSAKVAYLRAIIAARQGDQAAYATAMTTVNKDAKLVERAATDIEFAQMR